MIRITIGDAPVLGAERRQLAEISRRAKIYERNNNSKLRIK